MIFSYAKDETMTSQKNRRSFLKRRGFDYDNLVLCEQVHKKSIATVSRRQGGKVVAGCDGLITTDKDLLLGVLVADCFPVSFSSENIFGIVHGGWRGVKMGIIEEVKEKIISSGESLKNFTFEIGPGIGVCHFEIKEDLFEKFKKYDRFIQRREEKIFLNLREIIKEKIIEIGVNKIKDSNICTFCDNNYYSFRRGDDKKRMIAINYSYNKK